MRLLTRFSVFFLALICFEYTVLGQPGRMDIKLDTLTTFHDASPTFSLFNSVKVWGVADSMPDSALWDLRVPANYGVKDSLLKLPTSINVLTLQRNNQLYVELLKRYNGFLKDEVIQIYNRDSLASWSLDNGTIPKISIDIPVLTNGKPDQRHCEIYLFPLKSANITYNDARLNKMPLLGITQTLRVAQIDNADIYVYQNTLDREISIYLKVKENNEFHEDKIINNIRYRQKYSIGDTINIQSRFYKIDSVNGLAGISLLPVNITKQRIQMAEFEKFRPYFTGNRTRLVIDFWGSWCGPCIAAMPDMKELYNRIASSDIAFLGVCEDDTLKFDLARKILKDKGIPWPQIFDNIQDRENGIAAMLKITAYPTYMIVTRDGQILFKESGRQGFIDLENALLSGAQEKGK